MNKKTTYFEKLKLTDGTQYVLRLFGVTCWASCLDDKGGWFRVFGVGIGWVNKDEPMLFSERNGNTKFIKLNGKRFKFLKPYR